MSCGCINATENHATLNRLEARGKSGVDHMQFSVSRKSFATSYLKWSKLVHQRAVSKAIMMHSIVNNTAPEYLTSRFVRRCDLTSYNLRENEYKLAVPQPRTEFYKRSLSYSGSVLWNGLPLEVRQLTSPSKFKGKLRDINFD